MALHRFFSSTVVLVTVAMLSGVSAVSAAITVTTLNENFPDDHTAFDHLLSNDDLIHGMIATERPGDLGWHPANPAASNPSAATGLSAFTDGNGATHPLTGLLADFPGEGTPTKLLQYDLASPSDISGINILAGNMNDVDGRLFVTVVINYSTDSGITFQPLGGYVPTLGANSNGYYQSHASGAINRPGGIFDGFLESTATFMQIHDNSGANLASGVTNLQFDFYSSNNTVGQFHDPFIGVNPFTGVDDGFGSDEFPEDVAKSSPLIWEIDVLAGTPSSADFDGDGTVDGHDFLIWQRGFGIDDGTALPENGDANGDKNVDGGDLAVWQAQFGTVTSQLAAVGVVPEPSSLLLAFVGMTGGWLLNRRMR